MKKNIFLISILISLVFILYQEYSLKNNLYAKEIEEADIEFDEYDQVASTNYFYRDRVFGYPFKGLAMSIAPEKKKYEIGEKIDIKVLFKNLTEKEIRVWRLNDGAREYKYTLFFSDGKPVPKSEYAQEFEASLSTPPQKYSIRSVRIQPKDIGGIVIYVQKYFNIEKAGTYYLVMMRHVTESWDDGFLISNMTTINIVDK